jgi:catechol 2,3-dioxygenase-like lactoylglutathione lyase family enzyme
LALEPPPGRILSNYPHVIRELKGLPAVSADRARAARGRVVDVVASGFLGCSALTAVSPRVFSGEWIDRNIGLENVTVETVMARAPDGSDMFEVVRFHSPSAGAQELTPAANRPGLRHVAFKVDDVRGVVDRVQQAGWEAVGEIVDFENTFLLCDVRGPEGLIVELAERLDGGPR